MKLNIILKYVIIVGLFLILLVPFIVLDNLFFPYVTGKAFIFRILVELLFGGCLILALRDKNYRPKSSKILLAFIAFFAVITVADVLSLNPHKSFWSNFERMEGFITIIHLFLYFIVVSALLNTEKLWNWFWNASVLTSVIMAFYGFFQLAGKITISQGGARVDGTFGNASYLAVYMLFNIFITAMLLLRIKKGSILRYLYPVAIILQLIILYYTATRGAILGLIGGVMIAGILIFIKSEKGSLVRKVGLYLLGGIVALILVFIIFKNSNFVKTSPVLSRFSTLTTENIKSQGRYYVWPMAIKGIGEKPFFGWGQEGFNYVFNKNYNPAMYSQEQWFDRAHNTILDWAIAGGLLGLIGYLSLFVAVLYCLWKKNGDYLSVVDKSLLTGLLAGYLFNNMFIFDNLVSYIFFFSVLAYVHSLVAKENFLHRKEISDSVNLAAIPIVIVIFIFSMYFVNIKPIIANQNLLSALRYQNEPVKALEFFKKVFFYNTFANSEAREQLVSSAPSILNSKEASQETKSEFLKLIKDQYEQQLAETPKDARYLLFYGNFLSQIGLYDNALVYLNKALEQSPKKQAILFQIGASYWGKKDYVKAAEAFKTAYDLDPTYNVAIDNLINAYSETKQYNELITVMQKRVDRNPGNSNPDNLQYRVSLAAAYYQVGNLKKAIEVLQEAIEVFPAFKSQGEQFIKQMKAGTIKID